MEAHVTEKQFIFTLRPNFDKAWPDIAWLDVLTAGDVCKQSVFVPFESRSGSFGSMAHCNLMQVSQEILVASVWGDQRTRLHPKALIPKRAKDSLPEVFPFQ
jgi:hypothetical protein